VDVELTNVDRVVFPADGITKGDVIAYYDAVAPLMLPYLAGRPLSLERYRATIDDGGFFQQGRSDHFPPYVGTIEVERADGTVGRHPACDSRAALVYLANQGALTFHAWPARAPDLEHPDLLVLDLDPDDDDFAPVRRAAGLLREVLRDECGLPEGEPVLTGSRGVHVRVPLDGSRGWAETRELARSVGAALVARAPKELTRAFYKSQRRGRLYVDTGRSRRGHTAIVPYTVRARPGAPVAAPVSWDELLEDGELTARRYTIRSVLERG
jgi:bifunctional non-homologous end joining protein LigD